MTDTPRRCTLQFPGRFPPNQNGSRRSVPAHNAIMRSWRLRAAEAALAAGLPRGVERVSISSVWWRRALGVADEANDRARLKPIIDGLVDYGLVPNDTRRHVVDGTCEERRLPAAARDQPMLWVIIEEIIGG